MIVVAAAVDREWAGWRRGLGVVSAPPRAELVRVGDGLALLRLGVGPEAAAQAVAGLPAAGVTALLHVGYVGGLRAGLGSGTLLVATAVSSRVTSPGEAGGVAEPVPLDSAGVDALRSALARLPARLAQGPLLTVDRFVHRAADKRALATGGWLACEMEASVVAEAARARGIPYFGVRAVSDADDEDLPPFAALTTRPRDLVRVLRWGLRPAALADTWRAARGLRRADRTLEAALPVAVRTLGALRPGPR